MDIIHQAFLHTQTNRAVYCISFGRAPVGSGYPPYFVPASILHAHYFVV
ncbi:MAG TPA: hypothetical protein PKN57_03950 [Saprospiraceae bacterium]|nr:hypothetical protein [Saprospiraceae bacterium]MCC6689450.1 hypothetical protein [Saprospiraceae bacterium]HMV22964.1 hypothetical protein [Saprospiraceae bacterium]HMX84945.1 hypothetical protein [Saprospiraceae bacterium]HMZ74193.1 hypothetical protein [Saprospiraceae bacterium]